MRLENAALDKKRKEEEAAKGAAEAEDAQAELMRQIAEMKSENERIARAEEEAAKAAAAEAASKKAAEEAAAEAAAQAVLVFRGGEEAAAAKAEAKAEP